MDRRRLLQTVAMAPLAIAGFPDLWSIAPARAAASMRVRPGQPGWPSAAAWADLARSTGGRLVAVQSPLAACVADATGCDRVFPHLRNPYFLGDEPGLTQTLGWVDAWTSRPSVYAVAAETTADVVAAVNFARDKNLRLVVKGGGHSYQGTSNAADSLLVWTRRMDAITLHDGFVGAGCEGRQAPRPAVSVGAGSLWGRVYDVVSTQGGRYVQGGGCMTVGVAGLIQSGGFGSFSKRYGMAAASLLEAEIVTADGAVRIANACSHPDLFWALKGGGGGSLGVVTRLTLATHDLADFVGGVSVSVRAQSDDAFRDLVAATLQFYAEALFNPHWGEQIAFQPDNTVAISMVFQGLGQAEAEAVWKPFLDFVAASPERYVLEAAPRITAVPARQFWDPDYLRTLPNVVLSDDRPGAPADNVFWTGNLGEAGHVLYGYQSAWMPADLLADERRAGLAEALFSASRHWSVSLHVNKGLAGAPPEAIAAARETATHPAVTTAFALLITAANGPPAYPGIPGHEPDIATARQQSEAVAAAMSEIRPLLPTFAAYVSEGDFFDAEWRQSFWGPNYERLLAVKDAYDPDGLFFVHHGVGSERWSEDGFTRLG